MNQPAPRHEPQAHKPPPLPEPEKFADSDPGRPWPDKETMKQHVVKPLLESEIAATDSGVKWNNWQAVCPANTPIEDILDPRFWSNVAQKFKLNDTIDIVPLCNSWSAEVKVRNYWHNGAEVQFRFPPLRGFDQKTAPGPDPIDLIVKMLPGKGPCVVRKSNGEVVRENFPNAQDAQRFIDQQQRARRA